MQSSAQLVLFGFWFPPGGHPAGWRMPDALPRAEYDFGHFVRIAQLAEEAKLDALFFADLLTTQAVEQMAAGDPLAEQFTRVAGLEPLSLLPALAMLTRHIGLIATATTTYNEPYHVARRFASVDHISGGRAGWNLVTSQVVSEAQNFGFDAHMAHAERYEKAGEFFDVVAGLWDSWDEGALIEDKAAGRYFDLNKVHLLNHQGKHFRVRGPLNVPRSPQGRPVITQAGSSGPGMELAARTADCVFTAQTTIPEARDFRATLRSRAESFGRNPDSIKVLPGLVPILGRSEAEAEERHEMLTSLISDEQAVRSISRLAGGLDLMKFPLDGPLPELPPTNAAVARQKMLVDLARTEKLSIRQLGRRFVAAQGHHTVRGTPRTVCDQMEEWFRQEACDGFCVMFPYFPTGVTDFTQLVVPELQRRGLFRTAYDSRTLREHLRLPSPPSRYHGGV